MYPFKEDIWSTIEDTWSNAVGYLVICGPNILLYYNIGMHNNLDINKMEIC